MGRNIQIYFIWISLEAPKKGNYSSFSDQSIKHTSLRNEEHYRQSFYDLHHEITYQFHTNRTPLSGNFPHCMPVLRKRSGNGLNPCFSNLSHWVNNEEVVIKSTALCWVPVVSQVPLEEWGQGKGKKSSEERSTNMKLAWSSLLSSSQPSMVLSDDGCTS